MISAYTLIHGTIKQALAIGATTRETAECVKTVVRDHGRRTGRLLDKDQPVPPSTMVPCAGLRIDVLGERGGPVEYRVRRRATTSARGTRRARPRGP